MTVKEILERYNLTTEQAAEITGIPMRTLQNWVLGYREPAPYMSSLIDAKIRDYRGQENYKNYLEMRFG